jgi:hypothetical protein
MWIKLGYRRAGIRTNSVPAAGAPFAGLRRGTRAKWAWLPAIPVLILAGGSGHDSAAPPQDAASGKARVTADARAYSGFIRYHGSRNRCHGPDGIGSTIGPALVDRLPDIETFRRIVRGGTGSGTFQMKGFEGDPNVAPYIEDIYAYLRARAIGALERGRPVKEGR